MEKSMADQKDTVDLCAKDLGALAKVGGCITGSRPGLPRSFRPAAGLGALAVLVGGVTESLGHAVALRGPSRGRRASGPWVRRCVE